jgi:WD40 repeat protein
MRHRLLILNLLVTFTLALPAGGCGSAAVSLDAGDWVDGAWCVGGNFVVTVTEKGIRVWRLRDDGHPALERRVDLPQDVSPLRVWPISNSRLLIGPGGDTRFPFDHDGNIRPTRDWGPRTTVAVMNLETGERERSTSAEFGEVQALVASPSGQLVAWVEEDREAEEFVVFVADAELLEPAAQVRGTLLYRDQVIGELRFSRDEKLLAFSAHTGETSLGVIDVEGERLLWHRNPAEDANIRTVAFSADGRHLFSTSTSRLACYDAESGDTVWSDAPQFHVFNIFTGSVPTHHQLHALDVSPDGRLVAASTFYRNEVFVWDAQTGERLGKLDVSDYPIEQALFFDPSGKGLWGAGSLDTKLKYYPVRRYYPDSE